MQQLKEQQHELLKQLRGSTSGTTATAHLAFPPDTRATFNPEDLCDSDHYQTDREDDYDVKEETEEEAAKAAKRGWGLF